MLIVRPNRRMGHRDHILKRNNINLYSTRTADTDNPNLQQILQA